MPRVLLVTFLPPLFACCCCGGCGNGCINWPTGFVAQTSTGPSEVSHSILRDEKKGDAERTIDVRIERRATEAELTALAEKFRASDPKQYARTLINYYLPGMEPGREAWATAHYNPTLTVNILGLTLSDAESLSRQAAPSSDTIGSWLVDRQGPGQRVDLYRKNGKVYLDTVQRSGRRDTVEVVEVKAAAGRRFDPVAGRPGEYWVVGADGNLQFWDRQGRAATGLKVEKPAASPQPRRSRGSRGSRGWDWD